MFRVASVLLLGGVGLIGLSACSTSEVRLAHAVSLVPAAETMPEAELLDVGVRVFDPGVPEGEIPEDVAEELLAEGTFVQIRRAEALVMAVDLRDTLQASGFWGAVWVTPTVSNAADLSVTAEILQSDGDIVRLGVKAVDATGRVWIDKPYELETAAGAYNRQRYPDIDPYQDLFNTIANDLGAVRAELSGDDSRNVRDVAALRYASELTPESFDGYVEQGRNGIYELERLPASDDPMFHRTQSVRQRERLLFETLEQHYEKFSSDAADSYAGWREYSREEAIAVRELTREARWRTGIGVATIVASLLYSRESDNTFSNRLIRDAMMYVGADILQSSAVRRQERQLHSATLEELSESFDDEVEPLVVEVQGTQHRLTGTAEAQYAEWRDLLHELFISETGFVPEEMELYTDPTAEPAEAIEEPAELPAEDDEAKEVITDASGAQANGV